MTETDERKKNQETLEAVSLSAKMEKMMNLVFIVCS